jgi:predicted MPP superfamily phosphohydrolase
MPSSVASPRPRRWVALLLLAGLWAGFEPASHLSAASQAAQAAATAQPPVVPLPNRDGSLKFAVLGDFGTGDREQYQLADQMAKLHTQFPFELVILVGDNIYGRERASDFKTKFEIPYAPLLKAGVKFFASLGNHDERNQRFYKLFNMDGQLYYSFKAPRQSVRFFALETTYPEPEQIAWAEKEIKGAGDDWKIPFFHHPLYSSGERHGSDARLRESLEPIFLQNGVTVVFTGHDHFYERVKPQKGITYFVAGSGGKLRRGNIDARSPLTAKGFDTDLAFMAAEIFEDELTFNTIARSGQVVDSGIIMRRRPERTE